MTKHFPPDAQRLAALIADAKAADKATKAELLKPFKAVLLKERMAGTSVRIMADSLASMGVSISEESLRLWFVRQEEPKAHEDTVRPKVVVPARKPHFVGPATIPQPGPRVARADI